MRASSIRRRFIAVGIGLCALNAHADPLEISLTAGPTEGSVTVSLSNSGVQPLSILSWDTPFEQILSSDVFRIERVTKQWPLKESAPYIGREVKRRTPQAEHYLTMQPGESLSKVVQLNDYYRIDKSDTRQIRFAGDIRYLENTLAGSGNLTRKLNSPEELLVSEMQSNSLSLDVHPSIERRILTPAYNNCSVQEQSDILAATEVAEQLTTTAVQDLNGLAVDERSGSPRYSTWFGSYTEARFDRVVSNFESLETALQNETMRFDCGCDESGTYAYVYPSRPYDIFLCPEFRRANVDGTDSRAGTIIHELSHFTVLADTDDHVYSQRGAQSLANSDPDKAIGNADNHEYFAENTPFLEILGASDSPEDLQPTVLELDVTVTGQLAIDERAIYQVDGASLVKLTSTTGDADLFVYTDAALTAESCRSLNVSSEDTCEIFEEDTIYIEISAYSASDYELVALSEEDAPADEVVAVLALDTPVIATLTQGERLVYEVSGANMVELESLSGDADLFIFDSLDFDNATLVCAADSLSADSTIDRCNIPSTSETYFILVSAYTDTQFSVVASMEEVVTEPTGVRTDMGRLSAGESRSSSLAQGDTHVYVLGGAESVQVTSDSGDVDLAIYDSSDFESAEQICLSESFSADSLVDGCDVPSEADYHVAVLGHDDSSYTISSVAVATVPDDDPVPEEPAEPETPVTPEEPVEPETPVTPEEPVEPETPVTPEEPVEPETPVTPEEPVEPETPVTPEEPVEPETPVTPEEPVEPETPSVPVQPTDPETPVTPEEPATPDTDTPVVVDDDPETPNTTGGSSSSSGIGSMSLWGFALLLLSAAGRRRRIRS